MKYASVFASNLILLFISSVSIAEQAPHQSNQAEVLRGEHVSLTFGCTNSCHGANASGQLRWTFKDGSKIVAPSLHSALSQYSADEFEQLVRHGIRPDGTYLLPMMPSYAFNSLSDEDLTALVAYIRSLPDSGEALPPSFIGPTLRAEITSDQPPNPNRFIPTAERHLKTTPKTEHELGEYLAANACGECHGRGFDNIPDLLVIAAYDYPAFEKLMQQGISVDGRELGLMKIVSDLRFSRFTSSERKAIYSYLRSRTAAPSKK